MLQRDVLLTTKVVSELNGKNGMGTGVRELIGLFFYWIAEYSSLMVPYITVIGGPGPPADPTIERYEGSRETR